MTSPFDQPVDDVHVVIPIHRDGNQAWLRQAIASFPNGQTYSVVTNDGDMEQALNSVIAEHVRERWVMRFDSDDVAGRGMLHRLKEAVWDGSHVAYPTMIQTDLDLKPGGIMHADPFCPLRLETQNFVPGTSLFRRDRFLDVGGYRTFQALEDWDLWLRMSRAGSRFKPVPEAFMMYRQVPGSRNKMSDEQADYLAHLIRGDQPAAEAFATFYYQGTPYSAYLRCILPGRVLPALCQPIYSVPVKGSDEQPAVRYPHQRGAAIMQFPGSQMDAMHARWLQLNGHPVFVETDDNYTIHAGKISRDAGWQTKVVEHRGDRLRENLSHSVEGHLRIVRSADGVITTTPWLADRYREHNPNVWVCPNQVDPDDWPPLEKPDDGVFRIGWLAGQSHRGDWPLIETALRWAQKQKRVEVVLMGVGGPLQPPFRYIPFADDWGYYQRALMQLDVGLAPILPSEFALGRSDLKALDYAMGGACPVLQDIAPYADWEHEETCLKAATPREFKRMVQMLVSDRQGAREIAGRAREHVLERRTFAANRHRWIEAIQSAEREPIAA